MKAIPLPPADSGEFHLSELEKIHSAIYDARVESKTRHEQVTAELFDIRREIAGMQVRLGSRAALAGVGLGGLGSALAELARAAGWL